MPDGCAVVVPALVVLPDASVTWPALMVTPAPVHHSPQAAPPDCSTTSSTLAWISSMRPSAKRTTAQGFASWRTASSTPDGASYSRMLLLPEPVSARAMLAALRAGIKTVVIPKENEKDLAEIPDNVKKGLEILPVSHVDEVIGRALVKKPEPITWEEPEETPAPRGGEQGAVGSALPH